MAVDQVIIEYGLKLDKLNSDTKALEGKLTNIETKSKQAGDAGTKAFEKTSTSAKGLMGNLDGIAGKLGIAFGVGAVLALGKSIINTTAEMQKFSAMLTVALGSESAAQQALKGLSEFAAKTPFQLTELTESYVKLVNRGFKPTKEELTNMGDLAASQGKSFDQLTEAILDAQTGEGERLKELGIRMTQNGDKVSLSFKNQTVEVQKTDEAIRNAILSFGKMDGVAGSMEKTSQTIGGKLSNLGDNITQLFAKIGDFFAPVISVVLDGINSFLSGLTKAPVYIGALYEGFKAGFGAIRDITVGTFKGLGNIIWGTITLNDDMKARGFADLSKNYESAGSAAMMAFNKALIEGQKNTPSELPGGGNSSGPKGLSATEKAAIKKRVEERIKLEREILLKQAEGNDALKLKLKAQFEIEDFKGNATQKREFKEAVEKQLESDLKELTLKIGVEKVEEKPGQSLEDKLNEKIKKIQPILEKEVELNKKKNDQIREDDKKLAEDQANIRKETFDAAAGLANQLFKFSSTLRDAEISELESQKERGIITEDEYAKRVAEIKRKQAEADKAQALFNIAIQTAESIVKYTGELPASAPLLALAIAAGAIQAGIVLAKPIPEFAKGGLVGGGDQIIRINERGREFVTNAESTKYGLDYLEALNDGPDKFRNLIYAKDILPALKAQERRFKVSTAENMVNSMKYQSQFDDYNLVRAIKGNKTVKLDGETVAKLGRTLKPRKQRSY